MAQLHTWRTLNPDHHNSSSHMSAIYQHIIVESTGGESCDLKTAIQKVAHNIAQSTVIDKQFNYANTNNSSALV